MKDILRKIGLMKYPNKSILILGGGPSSRLYYAAIDLFSDEIATMSTGMSLKFFSQLDSWPDYWAMTDAKVLHGNYDLITGHIKTSPGKTTFYLPLEAKREELSSVTWTEHYSTGAFAIREASLMGFKKIYLLGIEGNYREKLSNARILSEGEKLDFKDIPHVREIHKAERTPAFNPNYWTDNYQESGMIYSKPSSSGHLKKIHEAIARARDDGAKVVNLSPISSIDCERGDFSAIMK